MRRVKEARRCGVGGECGGRESWREAQKEEADHLHFFFLWKLRRITALLRLAIKALLGRYYGAIMALLRRY